MELYRKVRLACRDRMSERAAARHFGVSRQSVRKILQFSVPPGYRRTAPVRRPKLDEFTGLIEQWLGDDRRDGYRKQRHTAKRIFERLRDEHGFTGGYTIVKDYVREHRRHRREMFVPLTHPPGHAQDDFGEAWAVIAGVKQKVYFFAFDLPQSDASYVRAYRAATAEAWVDGHVHAFSFFGAVALSIVYDNDRCLVSRIERDGTRRRTRLFSGFLSHYLIGDRYGRPGKGNDKGAVEGLVGWSRRNFMVPLPRFASLEALNGYLEQRCRERQAGTSQQATKITLPKWLRDKLKDPRGRNEIWHNHPAGPSVPSIAAPGPEDIAVATLPGVIAVSAVDDGANTMKVTATNPRFGRADVIVDWTRTARDLMEGRLLTERIRLELPLDEEARRAMAVRSAEATVGPL